MRIIDLRSDTVSLPTPQMRRAMAEAELGDDVFGEDPTVNRLEQLAAQMLGKEAALFTASGTMSNLVALLTFCGRGDEVVLGNESHIFNNEVGGAAALAGVQLRTAPNTPDGKLPLQAVEACFRGPNIHFPPVRLLCLENTHNRCGGAVLSAQDMGAMAAVARRHEAAVYLDGARIFNAAVALGCEARDLAREADAVSFCLSKGLACPAGALLCGSQDFIARARKNRKMVGGGMRQAGVLAAPGIVALETMVARLTEDHDNARLLAQGLCDLPGLEIDPRTVRSNIVAVTVNGLPAPELQQRLEERGLRASFMGGPRLRFVTHYGIWRDDIERALEIVWECLPK
ncbi:MAG: low-specificity L-threonine aldolase [Dehalococcoidia bacterium]|nr:low-specificity L-threonine aldolase [Dehalococcoidia bacterium]